MAIKKRKNQDYFLRGEGDRGGPTGPAKTIKKTQPKIKGPEGRLQPSMTAGKPGKKPARIPAPPAKPVSKTPPPPAPPKRPPAPPKRPTISPRAQQDVGRSRATSTPKKDTFTPAHKTIVKGVKKGGGKIVESVKKSPTLGLAKKVGSKYTATVKKDIATAKKDIATAKKTGKYIGSQSKYYAKGLKEALKKSPTLGLAKGLAKRAGSQYAAATKLELKSLLAGLKATGAAYTKKPGSDEGDMQAVRVKQTAAQLRRLLKEKEEEARKSRERRMGPV
jgi:hypothetical protein